MCQPPLSTQKTLLEEEHQRVKGHPATIMPYKNKASCHQVRRYEGQRKTVMRERRPDQLKKHTPQVEQRPQPSLPKVPLECRVRPENQLSRQSFQVLLRSPMQYKCQGNQSTQLPPGSAAPSAALRERRKHSFKEVLRER